jgi:hypothetical protein
MKEANLKRLHTMIPTIWYIGKRQNFEDSKKISGCQGLEGRKIRDWGLGSKAISYSFHRVK